MDLIMQAVDDYGRGHQASVLTPPSPIPQETEDEYMAKIKEALLESDFTQLGHTPKSDALLQADARRLIGTDAANH